MLLPSFNGKLLAAPVYCGTEESGMSDWDAPVKEVDICPGVRTGGDDDRDRFARDNAAVDD